MEVFRITRPFKKKKFHQKYYSDKKLVEEVIKGFEQHIRGAITLARIVNDSGIPRETISYWYTNWKLDHSWRPGQRFGKHRKLFTDAQERAVADFIRIQYLIPGVLVRRKHLRKMIFNLWRSFYPDNTFNKELVSYHFLRSFCKRQRLAFRKIRRKKRSEISQEEVAEYARLYADYFSWVPWNRILNVDETPLNYVTTRHDVLAECGTEEVTGQLPVDPKQNFTVLATISLNGDKLPPVFIAQGKTSNCHKQFDGMQSRHKYEILHSPGGFTNENVMVEYLNLVKHWMESLRTVLILDRYAAHMTELVRETARKNNIQLLYIPTSATDIYQPLDRRIFGAIKSKYAAKSDDYMFSYDTGPDKPKAADMFLECWAELSRSTVIAAWDLHESSDEEEQNDDLYVPYSDASDDDEEDIPEIDSDDFPVEPKTNEAPITPPRRWLK